MIFSTIFKVKTMQATRRMLLQGLQKNSDDSRGNQSRHQDGQNMMDYSVSKIVSMSLMILTYTVALPHSTMTPELQDMLDIGRHWNLSLVDTYVLLH